VAIAGPDILRDFGIGKVGLEGGESKIAVVDHGALFAIFER